MRHPVSTSFIAVFLLSLVLSTPSAAQVRNREGGDNSGGSQQAVPRETPRAAPQPAPAPAPAAAPAPVAPVAESGQAIRRGTPRTSEATGSGSSGEASRQNQGARLRAGQPVVGTAVPRAVPRTRVAVVPPGVQYYRGYSPWGFGGVGFGSYYGSFYDPYVFYDPYSPWYGSYGAYAYRYPPYGYGYPSSYGLIADGELRLKVKPRDAQVFVDGYYAGIVDDFDGIFQRLHLPSGPHRIEVRAPGYETLTFDVQIRFGETTKYEGNLRRLP